MNYVHIIAVVHVEAAQYYIASSAFFFIARPTRDD